MEMMPEGAKTVDGKAELIQLLIPLGLKAVSELLQEKVRTAGERTDMKEGHYVGENRQGRCIWGMRNFGSKCPRIRDKEKSTEMGLESYHRLQRPRGLDKGVMKKVLLGLSCRRYEETARSIPEAFGISRSTGSRRTIRASARKIQALMSQPLNQEDFACYLRCKVDYWRNSDQKQRWVAAALLDLEPRLRKVKGMKHLPELHRAIQRELGIQNQRQIAA